MLAAIFLSFILLSNLIASDLPAEQELSDASQRTFANTSPVSEADKIAAAEALQARVQEMHAQKLQAAITVVHERRGRFMVEHDEIITFFNAQLQAELQLNELWFVAERDKRLATIQEQLTCLDERERKARSNFAAFINGNKKADKAREEFDLKLYNLAPIARDRRVLINSVCADLVQEKDLRQKNTHEKYEILKALQRAAYATRNAELEHDLDNLKKNLEVITKEDVGR